MKIFLIICLASGLASSEKLDRSYLPPPGSKFSGGRPGDIEVPFEFPKETYSNGRPQLIDGKPDIELGINRRPASPTGAPDNRKPGFTNFQNSVPTTTTSYAITQTTTFAPAEDYDTLDQPTGFINGSNKIQPGFPGQYQQQPIRGPGQGPSFQYRPGQSQASTVTPYGTTSRPLFPGTFKGPGYLPPPAPSGNKGQPGQVSGQDGYPSGQPQGPKYQDGQRPISDPTNNQLGHVSPGFQQNKFIGSQITPSTAAPQYQGGRFGPTGPGYQQNQNQFQVSQFPSSTVAPQYQTGQRLPSPGLNQEDQFLGNQNIPSSTAVPSYQTGQQFSNPGLNQQHSRVPNQQIQYTGNQNFPSSTSAPTPGSIESIQFLENEKFPSTAIPNYQNGQRFTTPIQIQEFIPEEQRFGSRIPSQNQYRGNQNFPSTTTAPQFQDGDGISTPGNVQEGYQYQVPTQQNQNQYSGNQRFPSSTTAPQYQTSGLTHQNQYPGNENFPSTSAPIYQDGQRFTTPGQPQGGRVSDQQRFGSRIPSQQSQNQYTGNQDLPSSTAAPQYQAGQHFTTPGNQIFPSSTSAPTPGSIQSNQFVENQNFPSTATPNYQNGQRFTTPGQIQEGFVREQQRFGSRVPSQQSQKHYTGNQDLLSSTAAPKYQPGQRFTTPGNQIFPSSTSAPTPGSIQSNQFVENQNFPSTATPNYQNRQRFTTPGQIQEGFVREQQRFGSRVPSQQSQNHYTGNQDLPSSTAAPKYQAGQRFTTPGNQIFPSSTSAPTPGSIQSNQFVENQNFPSTAAPNYQNGQRFTTPGQIVEGFVREQQRLGSRVPSQQSQNHYTGNQNFPSSTAAPEYQAGQRITTPENQYPVRQSIPSSTAAPQYQDQRFTTPSQQGPLLNQPNYPGSTAVPQYQKTFTSTPGTNQQGLIPNQQNQRPAYNQQLLSSTTAPDRFIPGSQSYGNGGIQTTPGTPVSFPDSQGIFTEGQTAPQQPTSQTGAGFPVYGTTPSPPSRFSNQGIPSTTAGPFPARDFSPTPGNVDVGRPERPQAEDDRNAEIINYENILTPEGYYYSYDTSNGIHADEAGTVGNGTRAQGGFSYTGDDGKVYSVFYSADENGFLPRGDHLPTPPPIPEAIQRVIDQANKDKESGIEDDGSYNEEKYGYMKYEGPLTRFRLQNKTVSTVNGADIPDRTESRIGKPNKNMMKLRGSEMNTEYYLETNSDEELEREAESGDIDIIGEDSRGDDDKTNKKKDTNRRVSTKRPKPIKNLTVEDSRPNKLKGNKMPMKSIISSTADSLQNSKVFDKNGSSRRPVSPDENKAPDFVSETDIYEEQEDDDNRGESQDVDYDSDLINYKDDPNNRTDFHGLNKYLPNPKGANRKNQSSKNRPTAHVDGTRRPYAGVTKTERPGDRNSQRPQEIESDVIDEARTRIPSRKNKFGQKIKDLSNANEQSTTFESDDGTNTYRDDDARIHEEYDSGDKTKPALTTRKDKLKISHSNKNVSGKPKRPKVNESTGIPDSEDTKLSSDKETGYEHTAYSDDEPEISKVFNAGDKTRPVTVDRIDQSRTSQSNKNTSGKPKRPTEYESSGILDNKDTISSDEETGYEYTAPQRKFESEGATKFPSRTSNTTLRPFMTKNVYGDDNEPTDEDVDQYGVVKPGRARRPMFTQKEQYPGQEGYRYDEIPSADVNENERFTSTRKPLDSYEPTSSRRPFGRPQTTALPQYEGQSVTDEDIYNEPVRNQGSQRLGDKLYYNNNTPNKGTKPDSNVYSSTTPLPGSESYRKYRPGQYQDKPTDGSVYNDETTSQDGEISINRPGYKPISGQVPSTTYRPNYSFGDRTSAPNNAITVDGFGRPITSTNAPAFDSTIRSTYSTVRPSTDEDLGNRPNQKGDTLRPTVGRFGATSTQGPRYQSSTSAPVGEDFTGPKQPQRFDPESGYYYK